MNRRQFALLLGTAAASFALPSAHAAPQDNGHGHDGNQGNGNGHGNGKDHGNGNDQARGNDHGHGNGNGNGHGNGNAHYQGDHGNGHGNGHYQYHDRGYFRDQDHDYLVRNYDGPRDLPPGLRRKYYRNGTLPPGWQQRFRPMPPQVLVELPPVPYGYQRGYYDGYAVVVDPRTRVIYDAIDIVGALSGH